MANTLKFLNKKPHHSMERIEITEKPSWIIGDGEALKRANCSEAPPDVKFLTLAGIDPSEIIQGVQGQSERDVCIALNFNGLNLAGTGHLALSPGHYFNFAPPLNDPEGGWEVRTEESSEGGVVTARNVTAEQISPNSHFLLVSKRYALNGNEEIFTVLYVDEGEVAIVVTNCEGEEVMTATVTAGEHYIFDENGGIRNYKDWNNQGAQLQVSPDSGCDCTIDSKTNVIDGVMLVSFLALFKTKLFRALKLKI